MGFGPGLPGTKLTLLSRLSATSGAPNSQSLFLGDFHGYMMHVYLAGIWSILTSASTPAPRIIVIGKHENRVPEIVHPIEE